MLGAPFAWRALVQALCLVVVCVAPRIAWAAPWSIAPRPAWVSPVEIPTAKHAPAEGAGRGVRALLFDNQQRYVGKSEETYRRYAEQIVNETGLTALSSLSVQVDPSFETLVLHGVYVRRGEERRSRLSRERVRVMQREPGLDHDMVDGLLTVALFVEDLRVGDVVEWDYTLRGADPTLGGKIERQLFFGGTEAYGRIHARLIVDETRALRFSPITPRGDAEKYRATQRTEGKQTIYEWDFVDVPASPAQAESPAWFPPEPSVQISENASWADVAALSTAQFQPAAISSPTVRAWAKRARAAHPGDDELLLHAIRFVQDEVRYVGLEEGLGRRHPTAPAKVLERRFGDCKDKSALLVALLTEAGIEAHPALVSTSHGAVLVERLPSLGLFDHAIVQVKAKSGKVYWVDATQRLQGGGLERLRFGGFERALVLGVGASDFARMDPPPAAADMVTAVDRFELASPGSNDKAQIHVERIYRGRIGDAFRLALASSGSDDFAKHYADIYRAEYADTYLAANAEIRDDRAGDTFAMTIHLATASAWATSADTVGHTFSASAHVVAGSLPTFAPEDTPRIAPFLIEGPLEVEHRLEISLPFDTDVEATKKITEGQGFVLTTESRISPRKIIYDHGLTTTKSLVPPDAAEATRAQLRAAREQLAHTLTHGPADAVVAPAGAPVGAYLFFVLAVAIPLTCWTAARVYRHDPDLPTPPASEHRAIGGLLILLSLSMFLAPLGLAKAIVELLKGLAPAAAWDPFFAAGTATYSPSFAAWMGLETIIELVRWGYLSAVAWLFFTRRRTFPLHFTRYAAFTVAYLWMDHLLTGALMPRGLPPPPDAAVYPIIGSTFWLTIWIAYLHHAALVPRVFVRRLREPAPPRAVVPALATAGERAPDEPSRFLAPTHEVEDDDDDDHRRRL